MKEKPIIFSGAMVKAILEGRKSMTRRVMKPQPIAINEPTRDPKTVYTSGFFAGEPTPKYILNACPYGQPGTPLWVRESVYICGSDTEGRNLMDPPVIYSADGARKTEEYPYFRSGRFMPKWASRITLENLSVRVERLQEISAEDAVKEGVEWEGSSFLAIGNFKDLWDSINGKGHWQYSDQGKIWHPPVTWDSNPWVWRIEFRRAK